MKVTILQDFHIPNEPAFHAGEVVILEDALGMTLCERGLVEEVAGKAKEEKKEDKTENKINTSKK